MDGQKARARDFGGQFRRRELTGRRIQPRHVNPFALFPRVGADVDEHLARSGAALPHAQRGATPGEMLVYIGTYTGEKSKGIYVSRLNPATGQLTPPELAAEVTSPSFLAVHPSRNFLY